MIRLLGVFAHPDDDILTMGATLVAHRGELETTLVFATSGEAGPISDPDAVSRAELGAVREREQRLSMEALGVADDVNARFLRLPDYYLPDVPFENLVTRLGEIVAGVQPDVVVTFGADGMTSHHDHIRVGEAAAEAFDRWSGNNHASLFQAALPSSTVESLSAQLDDAGHGPEGSLLNLVGVPDDRLTVRFDARPYKATKKEAILAHRTQIGEWERIPEALRWVLLDEEAFVQARPPLDARGQRTDLFAGITVAR